MPMPNRVFKKNIFKLQNAKRTTHDVGYHESESGTIFGFEATIWQRARPNTDCNPQLT